MTLGFHLPPSSIMATEYASLRAELKQWEKSFQAKYGRKATPEDIRLVQGLADKYKRFKNLSKSSAQQQQPTTSQAPMPSKPIIVHSKPTENDRDPLPPSARPNPFSPVKKTTGAKPAKPKASAEFPSFPNLFASPTRRSYSTTKPSPPGSPNPFLSVSSIRAQPDSPFTAARKRIRGEGEGEDANDSMLLRPDKKRRSTMSRSVSASTTSAAPGLFASGSGAYGSGSGNLFGMGKSLDFGGDVLEESPVKQSTLNGAVYKPIFDDDDISLRPSSTSGRGTTSRTVSAPVTSFFGRKVNIRESQQSRQATDSEAGPSVQFLRLDDEDEQMEEGQPAPSMSLLAPTPVKGGEKNNNRWKGKTTAKSKKGKDSKSKLKVDAEDEEEGEDDDSHHSELSVMEVGWKIMGPLHTGALARDRNEEMEDADDDDENFRLLPARPLWSMSRRAEQGDEEDEPESVQIDVPDEMKDMLQLSPVKSKVDDEMLVQDILSGKGDRTKRAEVWLPGDGGDESDDWESEGAGWWEAEL